MAVDDVLFQHNPWWESVPFPDGVRARDYYVNQILYRLFARGAVLLSGLRRVGKSTITRLVARRLIQDRVQPNDILYVSLDDYLL